MGVFLKNLTRVPPSAVLNRKERDCILRRGGTLQMLKEMVVPWESAPSVCRTKGFALRFRVRGLRREASAFTPKTWRSSAGGRSWRRSPVPLADLSNTTCSRRRSSPIPPGWGPGSLLKSPVQAGKPYVQRSASVSTSARRTCSIVSSSVEVPAVKPTTRQPRNQCASRSAAVCT